MELLNRKEIAKSMDRARNVPSVVPRTFRDSHLLLHCETGPAMIHGNGEVEFWVHGELFSAAEYEELSFSYEDKHASFTRKVWYDWRGRYHRLDGPAIEYHTHFGNGDDTFYWYKHGAKHREDGPAVYERMPRTTQWFLEGKPYSRKNYLAKQMGLANALLETIKECINWALQETE